MGKDTSVAGLIRQAQHGLTVVKRKILFFFFMSLEFQNCNYEDVIFRKKKIVIYLNCFLKPLSGKFSDGTWEQLMWLKIISIRTIDSKFNNNIPKVHFNLGKRREKKKESSRFDAHSV